MEAKKAVRLMILDPGHFHAGLVQSRAYDQVDSVVHIYAPDGPELESYLALIDQSNSRPDQPTHWVSKVYRGDDYLEKMLQEMPGNVMVVAGNNGRKIEYVRRAIEAGIHVLADKPMVIDPGSFGPLKDALASAEQQGLVVNDIMTERHEITSILQGALSRIPELFGELVTGSPEEPAISKESVHYFSKAVAGQPLVRPAWFFDAKQQGEGIVDVSTHLADLIMWQVFPEDPIDYQNPDDDVEVISARSWDTLLTVVQFNMVTNETTYPDYLAPQVENGSDLNVAANGEFVFRLRGVHCKVSVQWDFENPKGGDTHYSIMRGTEANLVIRQDEAQDFKPTLYLEPGEDTDLGLFGSIVNEALESLSDRYPGLSDEPSDFGWEIKIPEAYQEGHEAHFARVTQWYLQHLADGALPAWERTNLLTKYFITTRAFALSRRETD
jgi:predicted dehydrogenase